MLSRLLLLLPCFLICSAVTGGSRQYQHVPCIIGSPQETNLAHLFVDIVQQTASAFAASFIAPVLAITFTQSIKQRVHVLRCYMHAAICIRFWPGTSGNLLSNCCTHKQSHLITGAKWSKACNWARRHTTGSHNASIITFYIQ